MLTDRVNPSGSPITSCDSDEVCEVLSCEVCLIEVPADISASFEGPDYVHHFCGLDCLDKWRKQVKENMA
ncbi:DUF3330 domain-containing protein [Sulfurirhabdus autotrophica]|uniref:Uncharacterized protein DUF3330 n=1 Tax=Sulfurirhabdus autotrophica TaxID=1706046 RepID=A0A4R3Y744_9PROT|nr:DUF3330 domain-containing protein [Sulfurirhabdus autotrophica]TCV86718.1 uncharacterized protein DUF3330 [Sulfurirhabdus autotrophica]